MWQLLLVLLTVVPGLERITVLNEFPTFRECSGERNRIGFDMAEAYPWVADFRIECRLKEAV